MVTSARWATCWAQHDLVVHLVDMVAGQHDDMVDAVVLQDVDVLVDRVGGALVPLRLRDALARRQDVEALVALRPQEVPAALQMADQAVRLVLGRHADAADARVQRVGQREVDDPGLAAEIDRGLGAPVGQLLQPRAAPSGEHERERIAAESAGDGRLRHGIPPRTITASVRDSALPQASRRRPDPHRMTDSYYHTKAPIGSAASGARWRPRDGDRRSSAAASPASPPRCRWRERGRTAVLLEARRIGAGASGRNGGMVSAGFAAPTRLLERAVGRPRPPAR